jgi:hypothetical protein
MALNFDDLIAIFPDQLWLDLPQPQQEEIWEIVAQQPYSNPAARWNAYLNTLCMNRFLAWLQEEFADESPIFDADHDRSIWDVVNGTVILFDQIRVVLVPDDRTHLDEICLPQEWVDIPNWIADYYLAVQLDLEAGWLRVLGYTTRKRVRQHARYELNDRTYYLDAEHLIPNLNVMWVAQELCPPQTLEAQALPSVSLSQIEEQIEQLSQTIAYSPRLTVPFSDWAAILSFEQYRQKLYALRLENCSKGKLESNLAETTSHLSL